MKVQMRAVAATAGVLGASGLVLLWLRIEAVCHTPAGKAMKIGGPAFNCWEAWFYRYQTLVIGLLSIAAAMFAARAVFQQVSIMRAALDYGLERQIDKARRLMPAIEKQLVAVACHPFPSDGDFLKARTKCSNNIDRFFAYMAKGRRKGRIAESDIQQIIADIFFNARAAHYVNNGWSPQKQAGSQNVLLLESWAVLGQMKTWYE